MAKEKEIKNITSCVIVDTDGNYYFISGDNLKGIEQKFYDKKPGYFIRQIIPAEVIE